MRFASSTEPDVHRGWAISTVGPPQEERADQEYPIRYDCCALPGGDASLVMTHSAPRALRKADRLKAERLLEGIRLPKTARNTRVVDRFEGVRVDRAA